MFSTLTEEEIKTQKGQVTCPRSQIYNGTATAQTQTPDAMQNVIIPLTTKLFARPSHLPLPVPPENSFPGPSGRLDPKSSQVTNSGNDIKKTAFSQKMVLFQVSLSNVVTCLHLFFHLPNVYWASGMCWALAMLPSKSSRHIVAFIEHSLVLGPVLYAVY